MTAASGFVGRESELGRLLDHAGAVSESGGWVDVVSGEPGIGKSSLIAEHTMRVATNETFVSVGRCIEGIAPPFWPWVEVLRQIFERIDMDHYREQTHIRFDALERFLPGVLPRDLVDRAENIPLSVEEDGGKFYLFQAILETIRLAANEPISIFLEDLHWADPGTCELLDFIVRNIDRIRVHLICTYRNTDIRRLTPIATTLGSILSSPRASHMRLTGLSVEEIRVLLSSGPNGKGTDIDLEAASILERTDGNSLFVHVLIESMRMSPDDESLPESVQHLVGQNLAKLDSTQQDVLRYAAVLGSRYPVSRLVRIVSSIEKPAVIRALDTAVQIGLMRHTTGNDDTYNFRHELVRETILEELSLSKRVEIHAACADALNQMNLAGEHISPGELYHHYSQSEIIHGVESSARHALFAARDAFERYDAETAIGMLEVAIESLGSRNLELLSLLYGAMTNAKRLRTPIVDADLRSCFKKSLEIAIQTNSADVVRNLFHELSWPFMSRYEDRPFLQQALELVKSEGVASDEAIMRNVEASLALGILSTEDGIDEAADRFTTDAASLAEKEGEVAVAALIRSFRSSGYHSAGRYEEQLVEAQAIQNLFSVVTNEAERLRGLRSKLEALCRLNRLREAVRIFEGVESICVEYPSLFYARYILAYGSDIYLSLADWENFERVVEINRSLLPKMNQPEEDWIRFKGFVELDKLAEARAFLTGGSDAAENTVLRFNELPTYVLRTGDHSVLSAIADASRDVASRKMGRSKISMLAVCRGVIASIEKDHGSLASSIDDIRPELLYEGYELAGYLFEESGDYERAHSLYLTGLEADSQNILNVGWLQFRLCALLRRNRDPMFEEWQKRAKTHAARYGLKLLERTIREFGRGDDEPARSDEGFRARYNPAGLTPREFDVLREIVAGKTDAEIAEALFISTKTASNHVGNILKKTRASNRTEAAQYASLIRRNGSPAES